MDLFGVDSDDRPRMPIGELRRIAALLAEQQESIVSTITDFAGNVAALSSAVDALDQHLSSQGAATHIDAADQTALDTATADLATIAARINAIVSPPAPAGVDVINADGSVTHADGTTTHPDGTVTNADGTPHVA